MIETLAQLLESFLNKEVTSLDTQVTKHGPSIGAMYEGLTKEILNKTIFDGLDLRVVSGFVVGKDNSESRQIDCMLVFGDGERLPFTDMYRYNIRQVIAVIEVKKTLYGGELDEAYWNLNSVKIRRDHEMYNYNLFYDAYTSIVRNHPPKYDELDQIPFWKQYIYHMLSVEAFTPLRIIVSYHGYKSEHTLRTGFINYISGKKGDFGPVGLPNLIICDKYSLVKMNGMPYSSPVNNEQWVLYASYPSRPMLLLLELLWTRLSYQFKIDSGIFGDDFDEELLRPLLLAKARPVGAYGSWDYREYVISKKELDRMITLRKWKPVELSESEAFIVVSLLDNSKINVTDIWFKDEVKKLKHPIQDVLLRLRNRNIISVEGNIIELLTDQCDLAFFPNGKIYAGENKTGRLSRWIFKEMMLNDSL